MKRVLVILSAVSTLTFTGCGDNENTTNPEPLGTVTINGAIISDLDEDEDADDPTLEKIPSGVAVYAIDHDTDATLATTTTTADGYSFTLQVGGPRDIRIVVGDFNTEITVFDGADYVNKEAIYSEREFAVVSDVVKGATYIQNIEIDQPTIIDFD